MKRLLLILTAMFLLALGLLWFYSSSVEAETKVIMIDSPDLTKFQNLV